MSPYDAIDPILSQWGAAQSLAWMTEYKDDEVRTYFLNYGSPNRTQVWVDPPEPGKPVQVHVLQPKSIIRPERSHTFSCVAEALNQILDQALQLAVTWAGGDAKAASWLGREFVIEGGDGDQQILTEKQVLVATEAPWFPNRSYHSMGRIVFLFRIRGGRLDGQYMAVSSRGPINSPDTKLPRYQQLDILSRAIVVFELIRNPDETFDPVSPHHTNAFAMGAIRPMGRARNGEASPHNTPA